MSEVIFLMGPTAVGKTQLALELAERLPLEIISVDSALVYRGMDIGTAKPGRAIREKVPHHLIDILDPSERFSVGRFCEEVGKLVPEIHARGRIPCLVGGTMMYFHALQQGMPHFPPVEEEDKAKVQALLEEKGVAYLHQWLSEVDPVCAGKIHVNDTQRITRALEVYVSTKQPLSFWQQQTVVLPSWVTDARSFVLSLNRETLNQRIDQRFDAMLESGFIDEVKKLYQRGDLTPDLPSIRTVGYREIWSYLAGEMDYEAMRERGKIATRQLAKRQWTWIRRWEEAIWLDAANWADALEQLYAGCC